MTLQIGEQRDTTSDRRDATGIPLTRTTVLLHAVPPGHREPLCAAAHELRQLDVGWFDEPRYRGHRCQECSRLAADWQA